MVFRLLVPPGDTPARSVAATCVLGTSALRTSVVGTSVAATFFAGALVAAMPAEAAVEARISLSAQRMTVLIDGEIAYDWPVSTGRKGYATPTGRYRALWTAARYYSRKYHRSPMPHSVFFARGYAVHGTTEIRRLGRPASHGCVRLHPANAETLYTLVREQGLRNSRIVIGD